MSAPYMTLADLVRRDASANGYVPVVDVLSQSNPLIYDAPYVMTNNHATHVYSVFDQLPGSAWKAFNLGLPASVDKISQQTEEVSIMGQLAIVDEDEVAIADNWDTIRAQRDKRFIEKLGQDMTWASFYANKANNALAFNGFANRPAFNSLGGNVGGAINGLTQVIDNATRYWGSVASAANGLTSIWIVNWDPERAYFIYPKGQAYGGVKVDDKGLQQMKDANSNLYWAWMTKYTISMGIAIPDPRMIVRIANIETINSATGQWSAKGFHEDAVIDALNSMANLGGGQPMIYCNRHVLMEMAKKAKNFTQARFDQDSTLGGKYVLPTLYGAPIRLIDKLGNQGNVQGITGLMQSNESLVV